MSLAFARRPKPFEPLELDRRTVAELARVLADRLAKLDASTGRCPTCRDGEASALLARLRRVLDVIYSASALASDCHSENRTASAYSAWRLGRGGDADRDDR